MFREISIEDGAVLFEWSALEDPVDTKESHTPPGSFSGVGTGSRKYRGWDFFHINSVDKVSRGIFCQHLLARVRLKREDVRTALGDGRFLFGVCTITAGWKVAGDALKNADIYIYIYIYLSSIV